MIYIVRRYATTSWGRVLVCQFLTYDRDFAVKVANAWSGYGADCLPLSDEAIDSLESASRDYVRQKLNKPEYIHGHK